jgi:hypothetical protein
MLTLFQNKQIYDVMVHNMIHRYLPPTLEMCVRDYPDFEIITKHPEFSFHSALVAAAEYGYHDIVRRLCMKYRCKRSGVKMAMAIAAESGHLEVVKCLYERAKLPAVYDIYQDMTISDKFFFKAAKRAAINGHYSVVEFIFTIGVRSQKLKNRALEMACSGGHLRIVKFLVSIGADVSCKDYLSIKNAIECGDTQNWSWKNHSDLDRNRNSDLVQEQALLRSRRGTYVVNYLLPLMNNGDYMSSQEITRRILMMGNRQMIAWYLFLNPKIMLTTRNDAVYQNIVRHGVIEFVDRARNEKILKKMLYYTVTYYHDQYRMFTHILGVFPPLINCTFDNRRPLIAQVVLEGTVSMLKYIIERRPDLVHLLETI